MGLSPVQVSISRLPLREMDLACTVISTESVAADVIVEGSDYADRRLPVLVGYVCFVENDQLPLAIFAGEYSRVCTGSAPTDPSRFVVIGPVLGEIQNRDTVGKHNANVFGVLISFVVDVSFRLFYSGKNLAQHYPKNTIIQSNYLPTVLAATALWGPSGKPDSQRAINLLSQSSRYESGMTELDNGISFYPVFVRGEAYLIRKQGAARL
jgi:hypothetical protein